MYPCFCTEGVEVSARVGTRAPLSHILEADVVMQHKFPGKCLQNVFLILFARGYTDILQAVKSAWPQQGSIDEIRSIGCSYNKNAFFAIRLNSIKLGQKLTHNSVHHTAR